MAMEEHYFFMFEIYKNNANRGIDEKIFSSQEDITSLIQAGDLIKNNVYLKQQFVKSALN